MATKHRTVRIDDDVWSELQKLKTKHGTHNAGLRLRLELDKPEKKKSKKI